MKRGDRFYPDNDDREWVVIAVTSKFYVADAYHTCKSYFSKSYLDYKIRTGKVKFLVAEHFDAKGDFIS